MDADYRRRTGRIFDIQKYSIHDGPGIRTDRLSQGLRPALPVVLQPRVPVA